MDKFVIEGGAPLHGTIATSGAKNSALPALAAALLTDETGRPRSAFRACATSAPWSACWSTSAPRWRSTKSSVTINTKKIVSPEAPYELVKTMRASSLVLGPLVARAGRARVSLPGGCAHRRAAHQLPPRGPRTPGRDDLPGARLHRSRGAERTERRAASSSTASPSPAPKTS